MSRITYPVATHPGVTLDDLDRERISFAERGNRQGRAQEQRDYAASG
jgi:hypothetical protein